MATVLKTLLNPNRIQINNVRHGHHLRGKAPGVARSIEQRLNELKPVLRSRVDIGFPQAALTRAAVLNARLQHLKENRRNTELEKSARQKNLLIDLNKTNADWLKTGGPYQIRKIADHYAIYEHLYGDAYFIPRKAMQIAYVNNDTELPVLFGNVIKAADSTKPPTIHFESDSGSENELYTLLMTNLDGHLSQENTEYVHWMIGNIRGNHVDEGELIVDYLQPFPPKGSGFHRFVFVLYKQSKLLDYSSLKKQQSSVSINLADRSFSTFDFYKAHQADLTPSGLAFFQSDWDSSLTDFYHNDLNMAEPVFEYDFDAAFIRPQEWFPLRKPFNLYMDKYKEAKEVSERYFKQKLEEVHPFEAPKAQMPFPNAEPISDRVPSWLKLEMKKKRMGWGRVNDV